MKLKLNSGKTPQPRRCILYGPNAIGKSTWPAKAKNCVYLDFEGGLGDIDCVHTDQIKDWATLDTTLQLLANEPKQLDWVVLDSLEWLEYLIHAHVAESAGKASISDIGFGKGFQAAVTKWRYVIRALEYLRKTRECGIVCLAHSAANRIEPPDGAGYDQYQPTLHKLANSLWMEWCDELFFVNYRYSLVTDESGFNERHLAIGEGVRFIRTVESPAVLAKSRLSLPAEIPFDWDYYMKAIAADRTKGKE